MRTTAASSIALLLAAAACGPRTPTGGTPEAKPASGTDRERGADRTSAAPAETGSASGHGSGKTGRPATAVAGVDVPVTMQATLAAHNEVRARHCAPPLVWSPQLASVAAAWAESLRDRGCAFEHSPGNRYGENLAYFAPPGSFQGEDVVNGWYREIEKYNFGRPGFDFNTGHFTQVVWRQTTELGCARAVCPDAELWVCNYNPPGNVQGEYRENVLPTGCK